MWEGLFRVGAGEERTPLSERLQPNDVQKRDVSLPALDAPEVTSRETALKREVFLRPTAASAKLGKALTEENPGV